ncbi:MAG: saccharopine dehydrogenase NADP-binding domain-containing protein [Clostridiales Family XIII bacterium]|jgi:saccharopine dehydrogenase-like NADP-dependent oxidoreductase|nr:saccharopine dehydrogenase NADP-binding domain-containing protein [Clostridiales Family XIII bacterium]
MEMGKKILVLGTGAQGSTVAQRMDEEPGVDEIVCADYDSGAVDALVKILKKAKGAQVDASDYGAVEALARGADLVVNALPLEFGKNVIEAALAAGANYQDFAAPEGIVEAKEGEDPWLVGIRYLLDEYGPKFKAIGRLGVMGTGSAPGLICVASCIAVRYLDSCTDLYNNVYEGVETKRFQPYWWSPVTALSDMSEDAYAFIDGEIVRTPAFGLPIYRKYDYLDSEVRLVEHAHDEPVYYGLHSDSHFKGVKNAYFKYGGVGIEFAEPLYRAGLLSHDEEEVNGRKVVPFDVVLAHLPNPPKTKDEIGEIISEGLVSDTGAMVVEAYGQKGGKGRRVEVHVYAPGLVESYEKSGISAEMYITGQGGALFTKLFANDIYTQTGFITSDMLTDNEADYYFESAAELGITLDIREFDV